MTNLKAKLGSAIAIATIASSVMAPATFAATTTTINNNGPFSHNKVTVKTVKKTIVSQSNSSSIVTGIKVKSNTGGNTSSFNTGGSTSITTGDVTNTVAVSVGGSTNEASLPDCGCGSASTDSTISDNGSFSHNTISVTNKDVTVVSQSNSSSVTTGVYSSSDTGHNDASFNTNGSNDITTGNVDTTVTVDVTGSSNVLNP